MQPQHRPLALAHDLLVVGVDEEREQRAVDAAGGLDHVRDEPLARARVDPLELRAGELRVLRQVVLAAVRDPLELRPADREEVLDVARPARVVGELVRLVRADAQVARRAARSAVYQPSRSSIQYRYHCSASSGGTKYSISICSNSRVRKRKFPGVISLRNDLPICAMPNGGLRRASCATFLKLTKMPCAVSGRRYASDEVSSTAPRCVESMRLNWRGSVRSHSGVSPGRLLGLRPQRTSCAADRRGGRRGSAACTCGSRPADR